MSPWDTIWQLVFWHVLHWGRTPDPPPPLSPRAHPSHHAHLSPPSHFASHSCPAAATDQGCKGAFNESVLAARRLFAVGVAGDANASYVIDTNVDVACAHARDNSGNMWRGHGHFS